MADDDEVPRHAPLISGGGVIDRIRLPGAKYRYFALMNFFPTTLPLCGIICRFLSVLVLPSKDFCFVKLSMSDFPVSIESFI